jgi:hypothetical protein
VSAQSLLAEVRARGADVYLTAEGGVRLTGASLVPDLVDRLRERVADLRAVLLERSPVPTATGAVLAAQRLLRECRFVPEPPPCRFHIGVAGGACVRCGAEWTEHYGTPGGAV